MFANNILLSEYSSYKIGGAAKYFYQAQTIDELIQSVEKAKRERLPIFILGGGTNLLINDRGFNGLILKPDLLELKSNSPAVVAGAGVLMSDLLEFAIKHSLTGLEWAGGLPGTLGGAIRGNAGAFKGEIKDAISEVVSLKIDAPKPEIVRRGNPECRFGYRNSVFKENDGKEIIVSAVLNLEKGDKRQIREAIEEKIRYRKERHPMDYPNIGSIFKNISLAQISPKNTPLYVSALKNNSVTVNASAFPVKNDPFPVVPTAAVLSAAGLKGVACGGAMISPKHPNFIVNVLNAKASDVKKLIKLAKATVLKQFRIKLEEEVMYV